jgi:hypothetical protein
VTSEGLSVDERAQVDGGTPADEAEFRQFCYRHPQRETYVRCGRCDRPICSSCAMQGPVGFRCRQCGKPARDPLTSLTRRQGAFAGVTALAGGLLIGLIGAQLGWLSLIVAFFGGSFTAEGVRRVTGYKQGPWLMTLALGGIFAGVIGGYAVDQLVLQAAWIEELAAEGVGPSFWLPQLVVWGIVDGALAAIGAYSRLR